MSPKKYFVIVFLFGLPGTGLLLAAISALHICPSIDWFLLLGLLSILFSSLFILGLIQLRRTVLADKRYLFYALVLFPGLVHMFAGAGMIAMKRSLPMAMFFAAGLLLSFAGGVAMQFMSARFKT
jgi:predicted neutral ceramidase superfamily lipid hydrolase